MSLQHSAFQTFTPLHSCICAGIGAGMGTVPRSQSCCRRRTRVYAADTTVITEGFPILESFKGVFIGPTINEFAAAIAGGTVGVMGTILALEVNRQKAIELKQCPYCHGSGKLACGKCYGLGGVPSATAASGQVICNANGCGKGYLQCNHCSGEGRLIPIEYERAIRAQYEDYVFRDNRDMFDDYYSNDGPPYL